jgi:predicted nucleotidyltransferase
MADSALTDAERRFLVELEARGVAYMIVGLSAASLQGANTTTVDVDLWFGATSDPRIAEAARAAGGDWISGFGMMPPQLYGALERFDVVNHMHGMDRFETELARAKIMTVEGVTVRVLPLDRIIASKRVANRPKDRAVLPALEEALAAIEDSEP